MNICDETLPREANHDESWSHRTSHDHDHLRNQTYPNKERHTTMTTNTDTMNHEAKEEKDLFLYYFIEPYC